MDDKKSERLRVVSLPASCSTAFAFPFAFLRFFLDSLVAVVLAVLEDSDGDAVVPTDTALSRGFLPMYRR